MRHPLSKQGDKHMKQVKSIQGFEDVGTPVKPEEVSAETVEAAETTNTNETNQTTDSAASPETTETKTAPSVDDIFAAITNKPKPIEKEPITIFIDSDIKKKFVAFGKKHGKGSRSELINAFLRSKFDEQ